MKRLLCLLSNMNTGGAETFLMKVYRTLDKTRYQMDFCIHVEDKCDYEDEILSMGGRIFRIPPKSKNAKEFKRRLTKLISEHHYRYVLKITSNAAGFWDLKIAKKAGAERTIARSSNSGDGTSRLQLMIHRVAGVLWKKYADIRIAPSDLAAKYTFGKRSVKKGEVGVLNNGLDLDEFRFDEESRLRIRKELSAAENTTVLGHIGRFNTQKNHAFLIRIFAAYLKSDPDAILVLVGVGDLEKDIRRQIENAGVSDKVRLLGLRSDIPALMSAFDVFVLPSLYEGMPNTVIEAQACSLPCVLSDTITRQADLSGQLRYLPLADEAKWVEEISLAAADSRIGADLSAYDIHSVTNQFCRYCFGDSGEKV